MSKPSNPALPPFFKPEQGAVTLRDLFAAAALNRVGLVSEDVRRDAGWEAVWAEAARQAYGQADAMLAAREARDGGR